MEILIGRFVQKGGGEVIPVEFEEIPVDQEDLKRIRLMGFQECCAGDLNFKEVFWNEHC